MGIKLEMVTRVLDFSRANPSDNPGQEAAVDRLEVAVNKAKALVQQEVTGHITVHVSVLTKEDLREAITGMVKLLIGVARAAAMEVPGVAARIRLRGVKNSNLKFLAQAQVILTQATEMRELFTKYGMPVGFLEEMGPLVAQFATSLTDKNSGFNDHVGANADLGARLGEAMQIVHQLDALNTHRFRKDAMRLAAWQSAHDAHWRHPVPEEQGTTPGAEQAAS
ncbi:MAG: hypothetical protein ABI742_10835 [Gemmatimonadota bacterium]